MSDTISSLAPGARIVVRDAEWLVRRVDQSSGRGYALSVVGLSELVRDKEAIFLTELEDDLALLDPAETRFVEDGSNSYERSLLYIESLLRQTPPTGESLYTGHRAAMDLVPYQLDPALQALRQPRQRILIADAVGLGKTLEAGILMSELIRRGRGKRILVVAIKSMLTQFQKELWSRFTIPLVRLDSIGIQRVRRRIPANHNPFYYYDRAIISVDTLKQDAEYRTYIENAYWDIIVIDEAHNVAERGTNSLRSRLAKLLATRSDTLIMLSATPHDGRARSFASLMNMLNPTAIADPDNYHPEDIRGLFIRRFKKDIQHQVASAFKERTIATARCTASEGEESAFDTLASLKFSNVTGKRSGGMLFKTTLEKSLFSSPAACLDTVRKKVESLRKSMDRASGNDRVSIESDIDQLVALQERLSAISVAGVSRYQELLRLLRNDTTFGWRPDAPDDRLVIFTERIETLHFLRDNLTNDLKLKENQIEILHGALSDIDQQRIVEEFGREESPVRLLIASDVASEGINLHYLSHRMIHFDIPWSLMVFQQRNGRIDRYGQTKGPLILYLMTASQHPGIRGDLRILELLIEKDEQAVQNIGDPSALMGVYEIELEEEKTARAMEEEKSPEEFSSELTPKDNLLALLMSGGKMEKIQAKEPTADMPSLYRSTTDYVVAGLRQISAQRRLQMNHDADAGVVELTTPDDLLERLNVLPSELDSLTHLVFTDNPDEIQREMARCRKDEKSWPRLHYLWELHPAVQWVSDKMLATFGRQEAPVLTLHDRLEPDEAILLFSGLIPNRKSHPLVHEWFGVRFRGDQFAGIDTLAEVLHRTRLAPDAFPNTGRQPKSDRLSRLLPDAVKHARQWMSDHRDDFMTKMAPKLQEQLEALDRLRMRQLDLLDVSNSIDDRHRDSRRREIERLFSDYTNWIRETMETEDRPYLQVVAALVGEEQK